MINGVTQLFMMKADVLASLDTIEACHAYKINEIETTEIPLYLDNEKIELINKSYQGWGKTEIVEFNSLHGNLMNFVEDIEKYTSTPVNMVSLGPNRTQTVIR